MAALQEKKSCSQRMAEFRHYCWNSDTGQMLGRTPARWGRCGPCEGGHGMRQRASSQQDPGAAGIPGNALQAMPHLCRKPGSPDGPEAQIPEHLQNRSKSGPNFSSMILKHHFKTLSETNIFLSYSKLW